MKTALFIFKRTNPKIHFSISDNEIVKTGIVRYFKEQTHDYYAKYFGIEKDDLVYHFISLKDNLFNENKLIIANNATESPTIEATTTQVVDMNMDCTLNESEPVQASTGDERFAIDVVDDLSLSKNEDDDDEDSVSTMKSSKTDSSDYIKIAIDLEKRKKKDEQLKNTNPQAYLQLETLEQETGLRTFLVQDYNNLQGIFYVKQHLSALLPYFTY